MSGASSASQAGLEALDCVEEFAGRHRGATVESMADWRFASSGIDRANAGNGRSGSILARSAQSDIDLRVRALESEMNARYPEITKDPMLERPSAIPKYASNVEREDAHDLLVRRRCNRPNYRDPNSGLGRFKTRKSKMKASDTHLWKFSNEEVSQALREAVECQPVGVVEALLEMGPNITSPHMEQKSKILRTKTIKEESLNLLEVAISRGSVDFLEVLASHGASPSHMAETLHSAVKQNLPNFVQILLQYGADPSAFRGAVLLSAIELQKPSLLRLLFRAPVSINKDVLTDALETAVTQNNSEFVSLLVFHKANVNHKQGAALQKAVQDQRIEIVLAMMKGKPTAATVSAVFDDAFSTSSRRSVEEQQLLIKILLDAGATGEHLDQVLLRVVREGHQSIAALLIRHHASPRYSGGEVLSISLAAKDIQMLRTLMSGYVDKDLLNELFDLIPQTYHKQETHDLISLLISKGADGRPLDAALVTAVQQKSSQVLKLLLDNQASADYNNAQALREAASSGDVQTLRLLLSRGQPKPASMKHVLPLIPLNPPKDRYDMTKLIVDASYPVGIAMSAANDAFIKAVESPSTQPDLDLIKLIISAGADVNCSDGKCFHVAAKCGNIQLLEILCRKGPHRSSLSLALNESMKLALRPLRTDIVKLLLMGEVDRGVVASALTKALEDRSIDDELVLLLLTKSDLRNQGSRVLRLAVQKASITVTSAIIQAVSGSQEILGSALPDTLSCALEGRRAKLELILEAGVSKRSLDQALVGEIRNSTTCDISIVKSLLCYNASCNYDNGEALKIAVENRDLDICTLLINSRPDKGILGNMLITVIEKTNGEMKTKLTNLLLEGGASRSQTSAALRQEICTCSVPDMNIVRLLIRYGARVDVFDGAAIKHAISAPKSLLLLQLLLTAKGAPQMLDSLIPEAMTQDRTRRLAIVDILLGSGAHGPFVDDLLVWAISKGNPEKPIVDLLLQKAKALNLNHKNGKCLSEATRCASKNVLHNLLMREPGLLTLRAGFLGIFESDSDELTLIDMARSFFQHRPEHCVILFDDGIFAQDSLYQCLHRHADKPDLLQWLLDNGCPADQRFEWQLDDRHGREEVSPLLWLLCQGDKRTKQRTIAILAANEGKYTHCDAVEKILFSADCDRS